MLAALAELVRHGDLRAACLRPGDDAVARRLFEFF